MLNNNSNALENLKSFVAVDLEKVNQIIFKYAQSEVAELIPAITQYITSSGGKRIRPILTLSIANMLNYKGDAHTLLAASVEFIHTATLLHDDVVDESDFRRGVLTANRNFGNKASILVGDYLFAQSFDLMVQTGSLKALSVLSNASALIAEGEVWQLSNISNIDMSEEQYFKLIKAKTAILFASACEVGAIIANADLQIIVALSKYGLNLGMIFQIIDDILDYTADESYGKKVSSDFIEGKVTLPLILALKNADNQDRNILIDAINSHGDKNHFNKTLDIFEKYQVISQARQIAEQFLSAGVNALKSVNNDQITGPLKNLITESIARKF